MTPESHKALIDFARAVIQQSVFLGTEIEGADVQDLAVKYGLMGEVPYDPEKHPGLEEFDVEPGDMIYMFTEMLTP